MLAYHAYHPCPAIVKEAALGAIMSPLARWFTGSAKNLASRVGLGAKASAQGTLPGINQIPTFRQAIGESWGNIHNAASQHTLADLGNSAKNWALNNKGMLIGSGLAGGAGLYFGNSSYNNRIPQVNALPGYYPTGQITPIN